MFTFKTEQVNGPTHGNQSSLYFISTITKNENKDFLVWRSLIDYDPFITTPYNIDRLDRSANTFDVYRF